MNWVKLNFPTKGHWNSHFREGMIVETNLFPLLFNRRTTRLASVLCRRQWFTFIWDWARSHKRSRISSRRKLIVAYVIVTHWVLLPQKKLKAVLKQSYLDLVECISIQKCFETSTSFNKAGNDKFLYSAFSRIGDRDSEYILK